MNFKKTDISNLNDLIKNLEKYRKKLTNIDYIHDKKNFFLIMQELRKFIASIEDKKIYETLLHSKYYKLYKDYFTGINMYYLRSIESVQSLSIMTKWIHNFDSFVDLMDKEIIKQSFKSKENEIKTINFDNAKTLIMIWTGPLPETLLYIYENTNIKNIIWIDYNHEAIFMSWEMISWLKLDKITLHQWNWLHYDFSEADVIYIPLFTYPKDKILDRIAETWKDSVQVLVAVPKWLWNLIYDWIWYINPRLKILNREDVSTSFNLQEVIKLWKYDF